MGSSLGQVRVREGRQNPRVLCQVEDCGSPLFSNCLPLDMDEQYGGDLSR